MVNATNDITNASNLEPRDAALIMQLIKIWKSKLYINNLRSAYYSMKHRPRDLGISVPPHLKSLNERIGWAAKAVDALAERSQFDGFTCADPSVLEELKRIEYQNSLRLGYRKALVSELKHACAFASVTPGDKKKNEPEVLIRFYPANAAAAIYDNELERITAGLVIMAASKNGAPSAVRLFTDTTIVTAAQDATTGAWSAEYAYHDKERPLFVPLVHNATLEQPFGTSRITHAVMDITDNAMREALRAEISSEFFTSPQKYLLGVSQNPFEQQSKWDAYIGNIFAIGTDPETGQKPEFGQLPQGTVTPHTEYMRNLAALFSGETSVPISELGVIHDNPASAEAIYAAKEALVIKSQNLNDDNGEALRTIATLALAIKQNKNYWQAMTDNELIIAKFKNPAMPSAVSQADAIVKRISAMPWLAYSDVALEEAGFTDEQIMRLQLDRDRVSGQETLRAALSAKDVSAND